MRIQLQPICPGLPVEIKNIRFFDEKLLCSEHAVLRNAKLIVIQK